MQWALRQLAGLQIAEGDRVRVQPCVSPVWDTAIATIAWRTRALPPDHPSWKRAVEWLLAKEVRHAGDWQIRRPGLEPTGWHFQFHNAFYPDLDDSAMVLLGLKRSPLASEPATAGGDRRGVDWLLSMQNRDGGWAAYDVDIDNQVLTKLPFADHNAMLDPSCADITARVIELWEPWDIARNTLPSAARSRVSLPHARARRLLVRALGRQLRLRHVAGLAGALCDRLPDGSSGDREGRRLARIDAAALGSMGRNMPKLRRTGAQRHGRADPLADGVGDAGLDRRRQGEVAGGQARDRLLDRDPARRRIVGREFVHGNRFSPGVLSAIPLLSSVLSR